MEPSGIITNIQRFSIHDGPGIRTTVFFKGCPLRCIWCHNPETYEREPELCCKQEKCIGCGQCMEFCGQGALSLEADELQYDRQKCRQCFRCAQDCPSKALFVCGQTKSIQQVLEEVLADKALYDSSKGGVTFSGGEATVQSAYLISLAEALKREHVHLALDTCGYCAPEVFQETVKDMDLCLFDIKHTDSERHKELTGVGNELILKNLSYLNEMGKRIHIRIPVIPGKNDSPENFQAIVEILKDMKKVEEIDLLGYHSLGLSKIYQFNRHQMEQQIAAPVSGDLEKIQQFLKKELPGKKVLFR